MGYCSNCGSQLPDDAKFCGNCGQSTGTKPVNQESSIENQGQHKTEKPAKKKKGKIIGIIIAAVVLILALAAAIFIILSQKKVKEYENAVAKADKYLEEMDYEQAEEFYLRAIEIDPKQLDPYIGLAVTYVEQEEYDKAEEVLDKAEEAGAVVTPEDEKRRDETREQIEEEKNAIEYSWIVEPTIEADDIYYVKAYEGSASHNELRKQDTTPYAMIQVNGLTGLIDMEGKIAVDTDYSEVINFVDSYWLKCEEPIFVTGYGHVDFFIYSDEEGIIPAGAMGINDRNTFYYFEGLQNGYDADLPYTLGEIPSTPFPVQQTEEMYSRTELRTSEWVRSFQGKFAIFKDETQVTEFIYDDCGSYSEGLLAVCQDGKWGYVDKDGNVVIPIEYDASWDRYSESVFTANGEYYDLCYAASDGYVTLCKDGEWELRDVNGKLAIPAGEFEEILPVYDGKCWAKQDGKWGVIQLGIAEEPEQTEENEKSENNAEGCEITIEWDGRYSDSNELFNLYIELTGTMDDGTTVILNNTETEAYDSNGELIGRLEEQITGEKGIVTIKLLREDGVFSLEGHDADYGINGMVNQIGNANAKFTINDADGSSLISTRDAERARAYTGVWYLGICGINHGVVTEYNSLITME